MGLTEGIRCGSGFGILCTRKESNNCHFEKNGGVREVRTEQGVQRMGADFELSGGGRELSLQFCEGTANLKQEGCRSKNYFVKCFIPIFVTLIEETLIPL